MNTPDRHKVEDALRDRLLARLKEKAEELRALLEKTEHHWGIEDVVYRFYHQSLKVYYDLCSLGTHIRRFLVRRHEGVVIATENSAKVTRTQQFKALGRLRSIPDDVAQADKLLNALIVDVLKDSSQRREVGVNITDDSNGFHVRQLNQAASRTA